MFDNDVQYNGPIFYVLIYITGKSNLVLRIHGYLSRYGFINFGLYEENNPLLGKCI